MPHGYASARISTTARCTTNGPIAVLAPADDNPPDDEPLDDAPPNVLVPPNSTQEFICHETCWGLLERQIGHPGEETRLRILQRI